MGMPRAPTPPDPKVTAAAQTDINRNAALDQQLANMVGQTDMFGNTLNYNQSGSFSYKDQDGKTVTRPMFTATQQMGAGLRPIYDNALSAGRNLSQAAATQAGQVGQTLGRPVNFNNAPRAVSSVSTQGLPSRATGIDLSRAPRVGNFANDRSRVESALLARMNPDLERDRANLEARAIAKGLRPGSAAYDAEMAAAGRNANDARLSAIINAGQEQSRLVDQARGLRSDYVGEQTLNAGMRNAARDASLGERYQAAALQNQGRATSINETMLQRNQPLNELAALLSGSQIQTPQMAAVQTPQASIGPADFQGARNTQYQGQLANWQAQMQNRQSMLGGIGGLFGSVLSLFSDRRLKKDIVPLGVSRRGIMEYAFRYLWGDQIHIGPMADEMPSRSVSVMPNGFAMVNYGDVL